VGKLIYLMNVSLDGFVETPDHSLSWGKVDEEILGWFNEQARSTEATLYGRRMYELMSAYWPTAEADPEATPAMVEFARIWNATPRIVFSNTLDHVGFNSRLVRGDVGEALDRLRTEFSGDLNVCGPTLASAFIRCGLIDAYQLVVHPVVLGAGTPFFPPLDRQLDLHLLETRRFASGVVLLSYAAA
jgi:dihydrofolate reductase